MIEERDSEISRILDENKNLQRSLESRPTVFFFLSSHLFLNIGLILNMLIRWSSPSVIWADNVINNTRPTTVIITVQVWGFFTTDLYGVTVWLLMSFQTVMISFTKTGCYEFWHLGSRAADSGTNIVSPVKSFQTFNICEMSIAHLI